MLRCLTVMCLSSLLSLSIVQAEEETNQEKKLNEQEQAFIDLMTNTTMVGTFSIGAKPDQAPKQERYSIQSVQKISGDNWIVQAQVTFGKVDVPVPVPVQMKWAGDTPVLQVTDLTIPLIGSAFTARVMFYEDYYAGTWWHGKVGGHMWGTLEKALPAENKTDEPAEKIEDEKNEDEKRATDSSKTE